MQMCEMLSCGATAAKHPTALITFIEDVPGIAQACADGRCLVYDAARAPAGLLSQDEVLQIHGCRSAADSCPVGQLQACCRAVPVRGWRCSCAYRTTLLDYALAGPFAPSMELCARNSPQ